MRNIKFKNKVKNYRESHGISFDELRELTGLGRNTLGNIEKTGCFPTGKHRTILQKALGCHWDDLFYEVKAA